jgi:hypothetical protein
VGYTDFNPRLNDNEIAYLIAFSRRRRCRQPGSVYVKHRNPTAKSSEDLDEAIDRDKHPRTRRRRDAETVPLLGSVTRHV